MRGIPCVFVLLISALATTAQAKPYRVMDLSRQAVQALDSGSIKRSGEIASAWLFTHFWVPQPFGSKAYTQAKARLEFDCANDKIRISALHFFADRYTLLNPGNDQVGPWNAIIPDAWVMKARNAACDGTFRLMGQMTWDDYDLMVSIHRDMADRAFRAQR